jgi:hypothetical protein
MNRIPPSQKIRKRTEELLNQGLDREADVTSPVFRLGIERVVEEMVEQEVTDYLECGHYQRRRPEREHRGYRKGYEPRRIRTTEGEIVVQVPQVRDALETCRSYSMSFLRASQRWYGVRTSEIERQQLELLRRALG